MIYNFGKLDHSIRGFYLTIKPEQQSLVVTTARKWDDLGVHEVFRILPGEAMGVVSQIYPFMKKNTQWWLNFRTLHPYYLHGNDLARITPPALMTVRKSLPVSPSVRRRYFLTV